MKSTIFGLILALAAVLGHAKTIDIPAPKKSWFASAKPTRTIYRASANSHGVIVIIHGGYAKYNIEDLYYWPAWWGILSSYAHEKGSRVPMDLVFMDSPVYVSEGARWGGDHVDRIQTVVEIYAQLTGKPIYLFGHSLGARAVSGFLRDPHRERMIAGAVFSAGQTPYIFGTVNLPLLIIHNRDDQCSVTPAGGSQSFYNHARERNKNVTKLVWLQGGTNLDDACGGRASTHSYWGIYDQVSDAIDSWLESIK